MQGASVELDAVSKSFARLPVVRDVSLRVERGEFFSLLGPSGCGKTTTLRLIAGFEQPDCGEIRYDGERRREPAYARDVNLVFQHYALFPHMNVRQNVAFGLEMQRLNAAEIERRTREALTLVHLEGYATRYPKQLSGGQQQRVALARALVTEPSILLLDEPLGALDLKLRKAMQLELKALQRRLGLTFIYVTHDQEEALAMSDRIAVMHGGRVLQVGAPEDIYERPATRFVAEFIGESNLIPAAVAQRLDLRLPSADGAGLYSLRPEKISLSPARVPSDNCLRGTIEDNLYLGTDTQYKVRVDGDWILTTREQNMGRPPYSRGATVYVSWHTEAARAVAPDMES